MIDKLRLIHMCAVANLMKKTAKNLNLNENEMFLLGFLHDVGYEFDKDNHELAGGKFLATQNYKFFNEVLFHGEPNCKYHSSALDLLNYCDMHINSAGKFVSFNQRLEDIALRYGKDSIIYTKAKMLIKELENNPKLKNI